MITIYCHNKLFVVTIQRRMNVLFLNNKIAVFLITTLTLVNSQVIFAKNIFTRKNFTSKEYSFLGFVGFFVLIYLLLILLLSNYKLRKTKNNLTIALNDLSPDKVKNYFDYCYGNRALLGNIIMPTRASGDKVVECVDVTILK